MSHLRQREYGSAGKGLPSRLTVLNEKVGDCHHVPNGLPGFFLVFRN